MRRSTVLTSLSIVILAVCAALCFASGPAPDAASAPMPPTGSDFFTVVVLPDTQTYTTPNQAYVFQAETQWIADNRERWNIVFVLHEGDVVGGAKNLSMWDVGSQSMLTLDDSNIPYAIALGNHDGGGTLHGAPRPASQAHAYFPLSRFEAMPTFGGSFPPSRINGSYHRFSVGRTDWLVLALEFDPCDAEIAWAKDIINYEDTDRTKDNRHRQTLIVTHNYLHPSGKLTSMGHRIWDGLVRTQENTSFVFCGDQLGDGARLISLGDSGNKIYQMFANYQGENAKNGTMRIVTFYLEEGRVEVASYSPVTGELTNDNNKFEFRDVRFRTDVQANAGPDRYVSAGDTIVLEGSRSRVWTATSTEEYLWDFGDGATGGDKMAEHSYGNAGVYTARLTLTADAGTDSDEAKIRVFPAGTRFEDHFAEDLQDQGWIVVDEADSPSGEPSEWYAENGVLFQKNGSIGSSRKEANGVIGYPGTHVSIPDSGWTDYEFSAGVNSGWSRDLGVMFRYVDPDNYYRFSMGANKTLRLMKKTGGVFTLLQEARDTTFKINRWYTITVRVQNDHIVVFRDGLQILEATDADLPQGGIGLYCFKNGHARFRDVMVQKIVP